MELPSVMYYNRVTEELEVEPVMGDMFLRFAYNTMAGRTLWGITFGNAFISKIMGKYFDSSFSKRQIRSTVNALEIDMSEAEYPIEHYPSFNAFFARKLKPNYRPFEPAPTQLISPADGRINVWQNVKSTDSFPVKGANKTLNELCGEKLNENQSFAVAIIRLCPGDYHRFHIPCDCTRKTAKKRIKGKLHSVNPIALNRHPNLHIENTREVTCFSSPSFGDFYYIEVGAFGVGRIIQTADDKNTFKKMDEKGYFLFGGSTVILILQNEKIKFDNDLLTHTLEGYETRVKVGNSIADAKMPF